jgi:hypothetical protein
MYWGCLPQSASATNWTNWLDCATAQNRPIGLGEYGLDQTSGAACDPDVSGGNEQCTPDTMSADQNYLETLPSTVGEPVALWQYWWSNVGGSSGNWMFTDNAAKDQWQSIETANGGG